MDNPPAELASVFRVLNEWQPMHTDAHLATVPGNVPLLNLSLSLPHDVNAFAFSRYASRFIHDRRLGLLEDPIRQSFLPKHSAHDNRDSVDIFKLILSYMFDRGLNAERRLVLADYIIQKGLLSEALRDEIFVQLINQTIGKIPGKPEVLEAVWVLLASCLSTFAPSAHLAKHLLKYVSDAGVDGFDAVCQHKLLQCLGLEPELVRSYPPCLLEWTSNKAKAAMALYAGFTDGEKGACQVESWTTGEQFALNMFRTRHFTDNISGWSVQLRDDVDTYECAGYDYVIDLISEMELPPSFPCTLAYFLTMTDISRPASTTGRQHWPDEPHSAERLRLMPLEVEELAEQPLASLPPPVAKTPPPPATPPPKKPSVVEEPPLPPKSPEPTRPNPEDIYVMSNEAMSQGSALNKRKDQIPDELSRKSVLNTRYAQGQGQPEPVKPPSPRQPVQQQQPPAENPPAKRKPRPVPQQPEKKPEKPAEDDMSAWLDKVFREALSGSGPVQDLGNAQAVAKNMKGGGDTLPIQYGVGGISGGVGFGLPPLSAYGLQSTPVLPPPTVFSQPTAVPLLAQPVALPQLTSTLPAMMPTATMPPALPVAMDPTMQIMQQHQLMQQQQQQQVQQIQQQQQQQQQLLQHLRFQQQQQLQLQQHAVDLQTQLQTKELEKQVLAATLQAEMYKQQLQQLQEKKPPQHPPSSSTPLQNRHSIGNEPSTTSYKPYNHQASTPAPPAREHQRMQGEVDESRPGGVQTLTRSYLTKANSFHASQPAPSPVAKHAAQVAAAAAAVRTKVNKEVKFADEEEEEDMEEELPPPHPPSPPIRKKDGKAKAAASQPSLKTPASKLQPAVPVVKASVVVATKAAVAQKPVNSDPETNGEVESSALKKAPGKIGIKWPPEPEKTEDRRNTAINRLVITETKEEDTGVRSRHSAGEIQQKMNDRIKASQQAAEREVPAPPVKKPPQPPVVKKIQMEDSGTQCETWSNVDMATKKKELESMLKDVQWGTQKKKEPVAPVPVAPVTQAVPEEKPTFDIGRLDNVRTVLHGQCSGPFYAYKNVPWSLEIRKEVFSPLENLNNPVLIDLVFAQVVADVLSGDSIRISADDKRKMRKLLDTHGVSLRNAGTGHSVQVKKAVIKAAKELPIFFSRLFPVNGGSKQSRVQMVAVSHSGVRLLARHKDVFDDMIIVFEQIKFSDIVDVHVPRSSTLLVRLVGRNIVLYTKYATHLCNMLNVYRQEDSEIIPETKSNEDGSND